MRNTDYIRLINSLDNTSAHYFAAANTFKGFVCFFDSMFSPEALNKIYILKGGPGVGKSTLMKSAAQKAEEHGEKPIYYHCSSDPHSLDGVLFPDRGAAIIDGTSPHAVEPRYAGVKEILVPLGDAWDIAALEKSKEEIITLAHKKTACYTAAYRLLSAAQSAHEEMRVIGARHIKKEKMAAAIGRFCSAHLKKSTGGSVRQEMADAISCDGWVRFFSPEKSAEDLYFVRDTVCAASLFLKELQVTAFGMGANIISGRNPLNPEEVRYLRFPKESVCVSLYDEAYCRMLDKENRPYKIINLARFTETEGFSRVRGKYRFTQKCYEVLLDAAYGELSEAGNLHAALEKHYGAATDYKVVSQMSERVQTAIFG